MALEATPLGPETGFNWVYLVELLVCAVLAIFFLFYFNRLFATVLSYIIRAWTWHKYRAYVDISALQISLLGGRIFFKSIRYHAHNITLFVHDGHITWRYWLTAVQEAAIFEDEVEGAREGKARSTTRSRSASQGKSDSGSTSEHGEKIKSRNGSIDKAENAGVKKKELPCRISVKVSGVEAFIYNRSPAYDIIIDAAMQHANQPRHPSGQDGQMFENPPTPSSSSQDEKDKPKHPGRFGVRPEKSRTRDTAGSAGRGVETTPIPAWLRLFPVKIECKRAAAAVGNQHTTSIITAKVDKATGTIDAGKAGPLDLYKLLFSFEIEKVKAAMRPNRDFKQKPLEAAQRILGKSDEENAEQTDGGVRRLRTLQQRWRNFIDFFRSRRTSNGSIRAPSMQSARIEKAPRPGPEELPGESQWHGLSRYLDDNEVDQSSEWDNVEYAKVSDLVESERLDFRFYFDMPGQVQTGMNDSTAPGFEDDDINGAPPPEYGMEFYVHGATVAYGPWADRQRIVTQNVFFAPQYADAIPATPLTPGQTRLWTVFKIYVSIEEDVVLRVPTRESSKDEEWQGRSGGSQNSQSQGNHVGKHGKRRRHHKRQRKAKKGGPGVDARPYGWLDVIVKKNSVVNYKQDMYARPSGYKNYLDLDVKSVEMATSVNHGLLWRSGPITLDADLSYPPGWNTLRKWPFNIVINDLELFILRDHFFLIIDIVNDWASGPPPDYYTFVPYFYDINLEFRKWCMYLNVNDANIINDPEDFDKNDYLTLEGRSMLGKLGIPMEFYRPKRNEITFEVLSLDMGMRVLSPPRSTMSTLIKDKQVAVLPKLTLKGSFDQNGDTRPGLTDVLRFDIWSNGLNLKAYGQVIRQLISLKENYFGDYFHFKTLEEFQHAADNLEVANAKTAFLPHAKTPNEMDVILSIIIEETTVLVPTNLYSAMEHLRMDLPLANLDLRIVSYYLDMALNLSPLSILSASTGVDEEESPTETASSTQIYISHTDLYGHRCFGSPPDEPAYLSQWDISVGRLTGECSSAFIHDLVLAGRAFAFAFQDGENALPISSPSIVRDITFVQVRTEIIRLWMHVGKDALLLSADPISIDTNDWARGHFSQRINVLAPLVTIACVDGRSASRHRNVERRQQRVRTYAFLQTGAAVDVIIRAPHFDEERKAQQAHVRNCDVRTHRTPFLQHGRNDPPAGCSDETNVDPAFIPVPKPPPPLNRSGQPQSRPRSIKSVASLASKQSVRSIKSTYSLSASVKGPEQPISRLMFNPTRQNSSLENPHRDRASSDASSDTFEARRMPPDDQERARFGLAPSSVAFASSFTEPYFPLDSVEPDETNVPAFPAPAGSRNDFDDSVSISETIRDPNMDVEAQHTSVFIRLQPGIRAYVEPHVGPVIADLLGKVAPKKPEDMMDSFQMDLMDTLTSRQKAKHGSATVLEINAMLPAARLRVLNPAEQDSPADQLDITIDGLQQLVRVREHPSDLGCKTALALHSVVDGVVATLSERQTANGLIPAIQARVEDVLAWVVLAGNQSIHGAVRDTELLVSGSQAKYLAHLALRIISMVEDMQNRFAGPIERQRKKLLLLIWKLTNESEGVGDPPFLTRMAYILRAFPDHFRNQESWKVLARFRHMLHSLPEETKQELIARYKDDNIECPADAPAKVVESWGQWRNWDIPNVSDTLAFRMLYSQAEARPLKEPDPQPLTLTVRSELLRVALEQDSQVNEIVIEETSLGVDKVPPIQPTGLMLVEDNKRTKTMLQLHTSSIGVSCNWSAVAVAEAVLPLVDDFKSLAARPKQSSPQKSMSYKIGDELERHDFHIVVSTDNSSLSLQTINTRHKAQLEGLKLSLIGTTQASERYGQCASALLNVNRAITEIHGPTSCILQTLLTSPSLYIDHLQPASPGVAPPVVTIAAAYDELKIMVAEQLVGILHVADSVVSDEVAKIMQLVKIAPPGNPHVPKQPNDFAAEQGIQLNVAVLAGILQVEISLLQSLSYRLDGKAASIRVAPRLTGDKTVSIDFDMGRQSHGFLNLSNGQQHRQGMLEMPPINGHVGLGITAQENSISVATTIERIEIDAAAVQGIVSVTSKPELEHVLKEARNTIEDIQHHVEELQFEPVDDSSKPVTSQKKTLFDVRLALLGVRVSASTPQVKSKSTAEVEFGIGPVHATASNRHAVSIIPEIRAQIQDIGARLWVRERGKNLPRGDAAFGIRLHFNSSNEKSGKVSRELSIESKSLEINGYPETAATVIDVINHLQDRLRDLDLSKEVEYLRRLRDSRKDKVMRKMQAKRATADAEGAASFSAEDLLSVKTSVALTSIRASWLVDRRFAALAEVQPDDAVFTISSIEFTTRGGNEARLSINEIMLQLAQKRHSLIQRSLNSALIPKVEFSVRYWSRNKQGSLAFKATGTPLDVRLESRFIIPVKALQNSIEFAIDHFKTGTATWESIPTASGAPRRDIIDAKRIASLLVEAEFAGAQVYLQGSGRSPETLGSLAAPSQEQQSPHGRYGQFAAEGELMHTTLKFPGIALKLEYNSLGGQPRVNGEMQIEASTNNLLPNVVPLVLEISNSVKEVMQNSEQTEDQKVKPNPKPQKEQQTKPAQKYFEEDSIAAANPSSIFGKTKVDLGLRVCRQEFGLSCQPIARVDAKAVLDDFYFTMNTIESEGFGHFFAMSAVLSKLSAQVKHMYSREPTFSFDMDSIVLSLMNSKHLSGVNGISAIVKINPTKLSINARQLQDLLLFREIWLPPEIRNAAPPAPSAPTSRPDDYIVQKYQLAAAAAAFPWNATVSVAKLSVDLDLGQSIGKSSFAITNLWASQHKTSDWEQNLCIGLEEMALDSTGRMSGFIQLAGLGVRTSIKWPHDTKQEGQTPHIQASIGFGKLRAKASFDYQAFAFGDIEDFDFLMYNVREKRPHSRDTDRLVAVLDCGKAYVFCTSTSPAQALGLYQAFERLIHEKQAAFAQSLKDIEKHLRRESTKVATRFGPTVSDAPARAKSDKMSPITLHTDVVLTLGSISFGVYPSTFSDTQIVKLEANNIQGRFAVGLEQGKIHSGLGITMGQLQVALASIKRTTAVPKALEISVDEVISNATQAKGGTIVRVPKVIASMQTWQAPDSNTVDYIFKSLFEGKIDVGWNLSRINFIKGMWVAHTRSFASRLGKALPESAVKITAEGPDELSSSSSSSSPSSSTPGSSDGKQKQQQQEKITAEVNLPQSRYEYRALETPIIETPQLRDMGEATPPLEWVGLHRDRLPNVTHQIIIVSLLEVAKEVEDAYTRILGSSGGS
ncbi:hypothetical protein EJ03DRAFT_328448 [Teratosphaeria nubilosa]|uniref:Fermentation associated protein n=1 Tax=Teratosphaeria nubilosa TaxID=161662 RepID=A0A6G1L5N8_9PEZI|nr:hypothetical protein EJ03DRAFT_328448 [Teratosphaeria nubilosa]